jgi:hypothetical protein
MPIDWGQVYSGKSSTAVATPPVSSSTPSPVKTSGNIDWGSVYKIPTPKVNALPPSTSPFNPNTPNNQFVNPNTPALGPVKSVAQQFLPALKDTIATPTPGFGGYNAPKPVDMAFPVGPSTADIATANQKADTLKASGTWLDTNKPDLTNKQQIDAYNAKVAEHNQTLKDYQAFSGTLNKQQDVLNTLNTKSAAYNAGNEQVRANVTGQSPTARKFDQTLANSEILGQVYNLVNNSPGEAENNKMAVADFAEKHPGLSAVAAGLGMLTDTILLSNVGAGFGLEAKVGSKGGTVSELSKFFSPTNKIAQTATSIIAKGTENASIFGIQSFLHEGLSQAQSQKFEAGKLASATGSGALFGFATGGAGGFVSRTARGAASAAGVAALTTVEKLVSNGKLTAKDLTDIGVNATVAGIFSFTTGGSAKSVEAIRAREINFESQIATYRNADPSLTYEQGRQAAALDNALVYSRITGQPMSPELMKQALSGLLDVSVKPTTELKQILNEVPESFKSLPAEEQIKIQENVTEKVQAGEPIKQAIKEEMVAAGMPVGFVPPTQTPVDMLTQGKPGVTIGFKAPTQTPVEMAQGGQTHSKMQPGDIFVFSPKTGQIHSTVEGMNGDESTNIAFKRQISGGHEDMLRSYKDAQGQLGNFDSLVRGKVLNDGTINIYFDADKSLSMTNADRIAQLRNAAKSLISQGTNPNTPVIVGTQVMGKTIGNFIKPNTIGQLAGEPLGFQPPIASPVEMVTQAAQLKMQPTKAVKPEAVAKEMTGLGMESSLKIGKNGPEYKRAPIGKIELKTLLQNNAEFKANPVLTVNTAGNLEFKGKTTQFEIKPDAMQLQKANLKPGDQITVDKASLQEKGAPQQMRVMRDGQVLASKAGKAIGTFEKAPQTTEGKTSLKLSDEVKTFVHKYAERIGEGFLPKGTKGVFYTDSKNIFTSGMTNVSTAIHEVTHFLDQKFGMVKKLNKVVGETEKGNPVYDKQTYKLRKQLTDIYVAYYPGGSRDHKLITRLTEGYATLLQKYSEMPQTITANYENLVNTFLKPGGIFYEPVIGEMITDIRKLIDNYQGLSSLDKIGSMISTGDSKVNKKSFLNYWQMLRTVEADDIYPFEVLDTQAGVANTSKSVSLQIRGYRNYTSSVFQKNLSGKGGMWIFNAKGEIAKVTEKNIGNLIQDLAKKKVMDEFAFYLVARDAHFEYQRLDEMKKELDAEKEAIDEMKADGEDLVDEKGHSLMDAYREMKKEYDTMAKALENNPFTRAEVDSAWSQNSDRFVQEEKLYDELTEKGQLDILHNAQLLNNDKYEEFKGRKGYASRKRVFYNELLGDELSHGVISVGGSSISSMVQRKGSFREIQNPLYSLVTDHHQIMTKAGRQFIYNRMLNIAPQFPDLFQIQKLEMKGPGIMPQVTDPHYIIARQNYKAVPILVDNLVRQILDNVLSVQHLNSFEQILREASQIKVIGTTATYYAFGAVNAVRDQITAPIFSTNKYIPLYTGMKELVKIFNPTNPEHQFAKEWFTLGGDRYTLVSFENLTPDEIMAKIAKETTGLETAKKVLETGGAIVGAPAKYSEIFTRLTEYVLARKNGKDQWTAMEDSQRVSGPFSHIGKDPSTAIRPWALTKKALAKSVGSPQSSGGQTFIRSIPFTNPGLQIIDQALRTLETPKGRARYLFVAAALTAVLVASTIYTKNKATPEQIQELKDIDPNMFTLYVYIPKPSGKGFIRIPIPQEAGVVGQMINMVVKDKMIGTDYSKGEYFDAGTGFLPNLINPQSFMDSSKAMTAFIPQLFMPIIHAATGMATFPTTHPIESARMKALPPEFRYSAGTAPVAKFLGKQFNLSPAMIDFLLTDTFGRATGLLTGKKAAYNPLSGFDQNSNWESGRTMNNYWQWSSYIAQETTATKKGYQPYDPAIAQNKGTVATIGKLMTVYSAAYTRNDTELATTLQQTIQQLASTLPKFGK